MNNGIVYLVGAGPGDPGLITVKGLECIQKAGVIVYDRLASPKLLAKISPETELIYVGKSPDGHAMKQQQINQLLVDKAQSGQIVTRLKGGDPFVFGRGGEEAETLVENGIRFEVVPGITSAVAAPAYAGIPVTHRDATSSFAVITGNEDPTKENSNIAWDQIATGLGTLVFLMGMSNLPVICDKLVQHGRSPATPVALVRWGTRPEQRTLVGTLATIAAEARQAKFKNPAVIVVGEVVRLRDKLAWFESKPLFGKRVLVTRSREQASELSRQIEELGGEAWEFPTIRIAAPADYTALDAAIGKLPLYQWMIFTSVNGVKYFMDRLKILNKDIRNLQGIELVAVGPKTKAALEAYGLLVNYVPGEYRAEQITAGLKEKLKPGDRVLLPRADLARQILPQLLAEAGAVVEDVITYRTVAAAGDATRLKAMLQKRELHILTFTSASTVKNFVKLLAADNLQELLQGVTVASIGPITSATACELGIEVTLEAKESTIAGLVEAIRGSSKSKK
ncbi:MAG: uroporphyrinogen-III C-methyltransferase [Desulfotomaculum sp.]|nr:uroporphyrinogen-III C-methyltransferase [Desulfotomaculum sp.]